MKEERDDPTIHTPFPPFVAEQEVKEREEKEREEVEIYSPPSIYTPPPYPDALHDVKLSEDRASVVDAELSFA